MQDFSPQNLRNAAPECGSHVPWYCVQLKPTLDVLAIRHLQHQGFKTFLPVFQRPIPLAEHRKLKTVRNDWRPLFPGYVFVHFTNGQRWQAICSTTGVKRLFMDMHNRPIPLPAHAVTLAVQQDEAATHASLAITTKIPRVKLKQLRPGDQVRITDGPWLNHVAIVQWTRIDRIGFLVSLFGKDHEMSLPPSAVVKTG